MNVSKAKRLPFRSNPNLKLLHRFYEPLVLLEILSPTLKTRRRRAKSVYENDDPEDHCRFLDRLAFVADWNTGGQSVCSLAMQDDPSGPIYWLATYGNSLDETAQYLRNILYELQKAYKASDIQRDDLERSLLASIIAFNHKKVKDYRGRIRRLLQWYHDFVREPVPDAILKDTIAIAEQTTPDLEICQLAFKLRHSRELETIKGQASANLYLHWRHYVGRLGSWVRAVKDLVKIAGKEPLLVDDCQLQYLVVPSARSSPSPDAQTNLEKALRRMFRAGEEARLERARQSSRDFPVIDLNSRFEEIYSARNFKPREHAECYLLEYFYRNKLRHFRNNRYIGCSKPSCYCCDLFFQCHPGRYKSRPCHANVWKSWRQPLLPDNMSENISKDCQQILNLMVAQIRIDAIAYLETTPGPQDRLPDSTTGISTLSHEFENFSVTNSWEVEPDDESLFDYSDVEKGTWKGIDERDPSNETDDPSPEYKRDATEDDISVNTRASQATEVAGDSDDDKEVVVFQGRGRSSCPEGGCFENNHLQSFQTKPVNKLEQASVEYMLAQIQL